MNVLIVDDQTHIVEGIYAGIDWHKIGVGQVLKAYNAFEAKQVLKSKIVDLMLSDIEMPGESGLELFRWVQEKAYDVTCIFLTSHADFQYAKEAIRLGGYDYIVQPAKYEDIERSLTEAIQKLKSRRETEKYSSYGKLLYDSSDRILQALLKEGLSGKPASESDMVNVLNQFHIQVSKDSQIYLILIDILMDLNVNGAWDKPTLWFALSNIVSELFEAYGQRVLLIALDDQCFLFMVYSPGQVRLGLKAFKGRLDLLKETMQKYFKCAMACYAGPALPIAEAAGRFKELMSMRDDNVSRLGRVFMQTAEPLKDAADENADDKALWNQFMSKGSPDLILNDVLAFLGRLSREGGMNAERLKRFYQNLMQLISRIARNADISVNLIFEGSDWLDRSLNSYSSVTDMERLIHFVMDYFDHLSESKQDAQRQVDAIIQYIRCNIENDIRRTDIAEAVHLTPNYVSRLFKNVMNVSLKSFITAEKMNTAKELLRSTKLPIGMVAAKVGYSNFSHFTQAYKLFFGITPIEERQRH